MFAAVLAMSLASTIAASLPSTCISYNSFSCSKSPPETLKYYVHALDGSGPTIVKAVDPAPSTFGQLCVFAYQLNQGRAANSTHLGYIRGLEVYNSQDPTAETILLLNTVTYSDGTYNGTISLHGQATLSETNYELTIVGGTGDFRGVRGYAEIVNLRTPGSDHVFEHVIHFETSGSCNCPTTS